MMLRKSVIACAVAAFLTACGGGGGDSSSASTPTPAVNHAPVANAGPAQSVLTGATVTLTGSASTDPDADALTYRWSLDGKPASSSAQLSDPATVMPTWRADVAGMYTFSLVVRDGKASSTASSVAVVVADANAAPVANAGVAQNVSTGTVVTLDGSASSDANGDALTYAWALTSRPAGSTAGLGNPTSPKPSFTADVAGTYVGTLTVGDGKLSSAAQVVSVTAAIANVAPVANAGLAQSVTNATLVTLDGSASSDANGDALTYAWILTSKPAGSSAVLSAVTAVKPTFTADQPGNYVGTLTVSDGRLTSTASTIAVTATVANVAPVANAGLAQNVSTGAVVTLDGSASSDANGDALTYAWTMTGKPAGSTAGLGNPTSPKPTFTADVAETYVATLTVSDGKLSSAVQTVAVTAAVANVAPVANAGTAQNVSTGTVVTLDGSASSDANGDALTYAWTMTGKPAGSTAGLGNPTSPKPTFTADVAETYVATLTVSDGKLSSAVQTVAVTAAVANVAPVANAGTAQNVTIGSLVTLDGSASSDANNDPLTYAWTLTSRPAGSTASLGNPTAPRPTFTSDLAGSYVGTLTVSDGKAFSAGSTVAITAVAPKLSLFNIASSFFGTTRTEQQFPYLNSAVVSASTTCVGNACPSAYIVDTFEVTAAGQRYTINGLATANLTVGSSVQPTFGGLVNPQLIEAGQTVRFQLLSPFTGGQTVTLRYSFVVAETGQNFTYSVTLRTN